MKKEIDLDRKEIYHILKSRLLEYKNSLCSETYGIEKVNFDEIMDIQEILYLILDDERKKIRLLPYIDLSNVDFKDQDITYIDFTDTNAFINPQTVKGKNFLYTVLNGLDFKGCVWNDTRLCFTNFDGAYNVSMDPQTVLYPSLYGCICKGIDFGGHSFKGVGLQYADLRGAHNVIINENEVWNCDLKTTLFDDKARIIRISKQQELKQGLDERIIKKILNQIPTRI